MSKQKTLANDGRIIRFLDTRLEVRAASEQKGENPEMFVYGYALKFDKETKIGEKGWGWKECIAKTALDGACLSDVVFCMNHDFGSPLARTKNGSLKLSVDTTGLKIEASIIDTGYGKDAYKLIKEGLIARMSYAATVKTSEWDETADAEGYTYRTITGFDTFYDVSAVTFPAYEDTEVTARSAGYAARQRLVYESQAERIKKITRRR